jgi:hypothetical protein
MQNVVSSAAEPTKTSGTDVILGIGGGSNLNGAKGVAFEETYLTGVINDLPLAVREGSSLSAGSSLAWVDYTAPQNLGSSIAGDRSVARCVGQAYNGYGTHRVPKVHPALTSSIAAFTGRTGWHRTEHKERLTRRGRGPEHTL